MPLGVDLPAALKYIGFCEAAVLANPKFDYDVMVKPLESRMMRSIWRIVGEKAGAEDALQDALALIWRKRDTVARHPNPQALILRIAISAAWDALRKSRRRLRHEIPGLVEERADESLAPAGKEAEDRSLREAILAAIGLLPRRQASAVLLRVIEEQSYGEIALAMDCAEATARIHVMKGKAALARRLSRLRPDLAARIEETGKETRA